VSAAVRCAVYTRKSTDEGLDQAFNSLEAQREACEAYIRSQVGEGWKLVSAGYDDGGYSGGNLNRPAMQRLLADVDVGKVDVVVVYKVDRLTRSLMDFSKIVERLDARGVSFVSVTQAFNTTTSMGRLTLNVLLSFAQFEREVTGERIRDKIAASKAKGIWMGGNVPLGYDLGDRRLIINPHEADQVRYVFNRFLELGSGVKLIHDLREKGITSKKWIARSGRQVGGVPFHCGALYYLIQNRLYLGEIVHRDIRHPGEHDPIVSKDLFDAVQAALAQNRQARSNRPKRAHQNHLVGLVVDGAGQTLTTTFSYGRGGRLYRYYVCGSLDPARSRENASVRIPAAPLEGLVLSSISRLMGRTAAFAEALPFIAAVELRSRSIQIALNTGSLLEPHEPAGMAIQRLQPLASPDRLILDGKQLRLIVDRQPKFRGRAANGTSPGSAPPKALDAAALLRSAHGLLNTHAMSPFEPHAHGHASAPASQRQRRLMSLGLLSPRIQKAILQGGFDGPMESLLCAAPLAWADQGPMTEA
jgi:site-specific DNA recombinase